MQANKTLKKARKISRAILAFLVNAVLLFGVVFNLVACANKQGQENGEGSHDEDCIPTAFVNEYSATTQVGYYGKITNSSVERKTPAVSSEKQDATAEDYPVYGVKFSGDLNEMIAESAALTAKGTGTAGGAYDWMDKDGNLFSGTRAASSVPASGPKKLYKHVAAANNYRGNVSDGEPAVEKFLKMRDRGYSSYNVTGLYAPAGEVITVKISEADMNATDGITIHIGQCLYSGVNNNIWANADYGMTRMPHLMNTMPVNKNTAEYDAATRTYTAYVGSFLGGPIYIRNEDATFSVTVSGGVEYLHFILGYTTQEEFNRLKESTSAPYFDLEVWDHGVLFSGPRMRAEKFSYDELYRDAVLWEKVSSVSTQIRNWGIVFMFDAFVAAGGAVSFGGSVNCPDDWMSTVLDYDSIVTSGDWGDFHEYHHNFQGFGVGGGGEVTNNSVTLVSYALFTKVSSSRGAGNYGAENLGNGWNRFTSATWALNEVLKISKGEEPNNGKQGLSLYATLLHNFGADNFIQAAKRKGGENYQNYMNVFQDVVHNDLSYYFNDILGGTVNDTAPSKYPAFVPVSSIYQTGRSYIDGETGKKKYIKTMQPYKIMDGKPFEVDLNPYSCDSSGKYLSGSIVLPDGFSYTVKNVSQPANGSVSWAHGGKNFTYTPAFSGNSGNIVVTLGITKTDGAFKVGDVDLVLEFESTKSMKSSTLERTTYTYESKVYTDAVEAYESNFAGYEEVVELDHSNPITPNSNTDIWYTAMPAKTTIDVVDGKLYFEKDGKYRVYLRGRFHGAMYFSLNGSDYALGAKIADNNGTAEFRPNDANTYFDVEFNAGKVTVSLNVNGEQTLSYDIGAGSKNWLYIKEVLLIEQQSKISFIGVGMKEWTKTEGGLTAPTSASYVNAYRPGYEFPDRYASDYFYRREYGYDYTDNVWRNQEQTVVSRVFPEAIKEGWGKPIDSGALTDGDKSTMIHSNSAPSEESPFELVLDMGSAKSANRMDLFTQQRGDMQYPTNFKLYGSLDGDTYFLVAEAVDATTVKINNDVARVRVDFEEKTFRYYKLVMTKSSRDYIIIGEIELWRIREINGGTQITPDSPALSFYGDWKIERAMSSFGHVYVGKASAVLSFEFTGTRLGVLSPSAFGKNFEVYIDGAKVDSIALKADSSDTVASFLSGALTKGKHRVEIRCTGEASFDSFIVYP